MKKLIREPCRVWFTVCLFVSLSTSWVLCMFFRYVVPGTVIQKQGRACAVCKYCFKYLVLLPCPWIQIKAPSQDEWSRLLDRTNVFVALNHTSFLDSIIFAALCPPNVIKRYRTLMKASLFKLPLLGGVCEIVGHFPVAFVTEHEDEFQFDKTAMIRTMDGVRAHVASGGGLSVFPEGKINRNPKELLPFRKSSLGIASEFNMTVVSLASVGGTDCWPRSCQVGGYPAKIKIILREIVKEGHGLDATELRNRTQSGMQQDLNALFASHR